MLLAAALAALATPVVALPSLAVVPAIQPAAQPALWVLRDADTTIYLFGTFHALDARSAWFGRNVRAAFDSSDQLMLETLVPSDPIELINLLSRHALVAPPVPGLPVVAGPSGSFVASSRRAMTAGQSAGMSIERGADAVLRNIADAEGKPVGGLESFDAQLTMFTSLPSPTAVAAPTAAPSTALTVPPPDPRRLLLDMRAASERGDPASFAAVLTALEVQSPVAYQRLFVNRNSDWAGWIAQRMNQPGTVFVAVGTGHLIGHDSVQQQLSLRGYRTTRIY